jgi:hypothetical protein
MERHYGKSLPCFGGPCDGSSLWHSEGETSLALGRGGRYVVCRADSIPSYGNWHPHVLVWRWCEYRGVTGTHAE